MYSTISEWLQSLSLPYHSKLFFSKYIYLHKGRTESREIISIPYRDFSEQWYNEQTKSMNEDQELAIHSKIIMDGRVRQLYFVDFSIKPSKEIQQNIGKILSASFNSNINLYLLESGRSYHGYFSKYSDTRRWKKFLGSLLLFNNSEIYSERLVDERWIGHCLLQEWGALRISRNTNKYIKIPEPIAKLTL